MYTALYRAERPEVFSEVLGQDHIVRILQNQIKTNTVSHAYLFCGTRGTGKTTTARILAKAVNCLSDGDKPCGVCENCKAIKEGNFIDVIEIDAASNNGVDNIRELRESVNYPPAVGRMKVYIIDEVHMLTAGAENALLKTLEEPPENVMFILATTDPQKLLQTILSRCMRLDFKRVSETVLINHMERICKERGVEITPGALRLLGTNADGSVRDGLSILDQCLSAGDKKLDREDILDFLGTVSEEFFIELTEKVNLHNAAEALVILDSALREGKDVKQLMKDWMSHYRNLLITKYIKNPEDMLNMSAENIQMLAEQSNRISLEEINDGITILSRTINDAKYSTQPRILLELAIVTLATGLVDNNPGLKIKPQQAQISKATAPRTSKPSSAATATASGEAGNPSDNLTLDSSSPKGAAAVDADGAANFDLDQLWQEVLETGMASIPSFSMLRFSSLVGINDREFKVVVGSELMESYLEQNRATLCSIMEEKTGKGRALVCSVEGQSEEDNSNAEIAEQIAEETNIKFGINVEIK